MILVSQESMNCIECPEAQNENQNVQAYSTK